MYAGAITGQSAATAGPAICAPSAATASQNRLIGPPGRSLFGRDHNYKVLPWLLPPSHSRVENRRLSDPRAVRRPSPIATRKRALGCRLSICVRQIRRRFATFVDLLSEVAPLRAAANIRKSFHPVWVCGIFAYIRRYRDPSSYSPKINDLRSPDEWVRLRLLRPNSTIDRNIRWFSSGRPAAPLVASMRATLWPS